MEPRLLESHRMHGTVDKGVMYQAHTFKSIFEFKAWLLLRDWSAIRKQSPS